MRKIHWVLGALGLALAIAASLWLAARTGHGPVQTSPEPVTTSLPFSINTYTGSTTISGGTLSIGGSNGGGGRPLTPGSVTGQPLTDTPQSLEWMVADSQVVAVGRVVEREPATGWEGGWRIRFQVTEMIRGPALRELLFLDTYGPMSGVRYVIGYHAPAPAPLQLIVLGPVRSERGLASYPSSQPADSFEYELRHIANPLKSKTDFAKYALDADLSPGIPSMDFRVLRNPDEVLAAARAAAKAVADGRQRQCVTMPGVFTNQPSGAQFGHVTDPWGRPGPGRFDGKRPGDRQARVVDQGSLVVPLDERLEKVAKDWIAGDDSQKRELALYDLLRPFKSPENIAYLQSLLNDNRFIYYDDNELVYRFFHVRVYAAKLLNDWGIDTPRPVDEEMVYYRPVRWWPWIAGAIALLTVLAALRIVWGRRAARSDRSPGALRFIGLRLTGGLAGLSALICLALGCLWIRSHYRIDDLRTNTSNYSTDSRRIFSYAGRLHFRQETMRKSSWPKFMHGSFPTHGEWDEVWDRQLPIPASAKTHFNRLGASACTHAPIQTKGVIPGWFAVTVPYWMPTLATGLLPAWTLLSATWRYRRRKRGGLCINCGYDLRASPGRCPECGKEKA